MMDQPAKCIFWHNISCIHVGDIPLFPFLTTKTQGILCNSLLEGLIHCSDCMFEDLKDFFHSGGQKRELKYLLSIEKSGP